MLQVGRELNSIDLALDYFSSNKSFPCQNTGEVKVSEFQVKEKFHESH